MHESKKDENREALNSINNSGEILTDLEELEKRLSMQAVTDPGLCIWYTCPGVCPPGG